MQNESCRQYKKKSESRSLKCMRFTMCVVHFHTALCFQSKQCAVWKRVWLCARVSGVLPGMKYCPTMHSAFERICKCTKLYSINHKLHTHTNPVQESNDQIQLKASTALNGLWTFGNAKIDWMNVETFSEASGFKYFDLFVCVYTIFWQSNVLRTFLTL